MDDRLTFLSTIPIFSFLNRTEMETLQGLFAEEVFQKGDTICKVGDPGDKFYVILSGELEVWGGTQGDIPTGILGAQDFFGEMALLQGGKRTATITVSRRSRLLSLDKASFERMFLTNPKALEYFAKVLTKRLASVTRGDSAVKSTMVISVAGHPGLKGKSTVASAIAGILKELTGSEVLLVRVRPAKTGPGTEIARLLSQDLAMAPGQIQKDLKVEEPGYSVLQIDSLLDKSKSFYGESGSNLVVQLSRFFPYIIFDLGSGPQALLDATGAFSDVLVELIENPDQAPLAPPGSMKVYRVLNLHNRNSSRICISDCEPFVLPDELQLSNGLSPYGFINKNRTSPVSLPLYRLGRKLLGSTVGLALGGGAAFGIAHIGVLKVLEENNIPVDIVAGCSQGSIIGVGYAAGIPTDELVALARRLGRKRNTFAPLDFTVTRPGILAGNKMIKIFSPLLKGKSTFEDLVIPCMTIATDIESGERVAIGSGKLSDAFRASSSVPMIFAPYKIGERVLVDGGVADPVPAEVVRQMGADICIAVNVVPPLKRGVETVISRTFRQLNLLNPLSYLADSQGLPNLLDIVMNSMQVLQYELGNFKAISADVLINPDLSDFTWIEYYRAEELIKRGVEAAERGIPAIKKAIEDKLSPARKRRAEASLMAQTA